MKKRFIPEAYFVAKSASSSDETESILRTASNLSGLGILQDWKCILLMLTITSDKRIVFPAQHLAEKRVIPIDGTRRPEQNIAQLKNLLDAGANGIGLTDYILTT